MGDKMPSIEKTRDMKTSDKLARELIEAVTAGNISWVRQLLAAGLHPDTPDSEGRVALREAAAGNHYHIAFELLNRGAVVDAVNPAGRTPLMTACSCCHGEMVSLLLFYGANPDQADTDGMTALMIAAEVGSFRVVGILLDFLPPININAVDSRKRSALDIAVEKRNYKVSSMLVAAGTYKTNGKTFVRRAQKEVNRYAVVAGIGGEI